MLATLGRPSRFGTIAGASALVLGTLFAAAPAMAAPSTLRICHAKASSDQPYVSQHPGNISAHFDDAQDIIPPFGDFAGMNWDAASQALWNNGCAAQAPAPVNNAPTVGVAAEDAFVDLHSGCPTHHCSGHRHCDGN
ncbi:MAG: hypothetical protein Q7L55_09940 [Actinomycetota bacterium]|nr:hypothetical protein [Actinomycetota bacterium]